MKKIFLIIMIFGFLAADVNEKDILIKEANRFSLRRQYEKAISLYIELQQKYPEDPVVAEKLIDNYLLTSRNDEAEKSLEAFKKILPELTYIKLKTSILLAGSEIRNAEKLCDKFLHNNPGKINSYKLMATVFRRYRQYEYSIQILKEVRQIAQDEYLNTNEMASDYYQIKDYPNSIKEYLKHVVKNSAYNNFVQNRIKLILKEDSLQIKAVEEFAGSSENLLVQEIYAVSLGEIGDITAALEVYEVLEPDKLLKFADNLKKTGDLANATRAFVQYKNNASSPDLLADVDVKIARIYLLQKDYASAEMVLMDVYNMDSIKDKKLRYKTKANRVCREMLADLALMNDQLEKVVPFLEEAKEFTYNLTEKNLLNFRIVNFQIMATEYELAEDHLEQILLKQDTGSDIYKKGFYYKYLLSLMNNSSESDSLLGELLINIPDNKNINDAIQISLLLAELDSNGREDFLSAFRLMQLFKYTEAVNIMQKLYDDTGNENISIITGDWAISNNDYSLAAEIFDREYTDEDFAQYALLQKVLITDERELKISSTEDFLTKNPRSVFSPGFRKILMEK